MEAYSIENPKTLFRVHQKANTKSIGVISNIGESQILCKDHIPEFERSFLRRDKINEAQRSTKESRSSSQRIQISAWPKFLCIAKK